MRQREDGVCWAYSKTNGNSYAFQRADYPRLMTEWMAGEAFFTGTGFYGSPLTVKLGDISAVHDASPESMRDGRADRAADEREDAIA